MYIQMFVFYKIDNNFFYLFSFIDFNYLMSNENIIFASLI